MTDRVRQALDRLDENLARHLERIAHTDQREFWTILHQACEAQLRQSKQPVAKHGGSRVP